MGRFRWLYYLLRPSRVDFSVLAAQAKEPLPEHLLSSWIRETPADGRVHVSPGGVGFIRLKRTRVLDRISNVTARSGGYDNDPF